MRVRVFGSLGLAAMLLAVGGDTIRAANTLGLWSPLPYGNHARWKPGRYRMDPHAARAW
jgi:hypothetical protein